MKYKSFAWITLLLSGCTLIPDYKLPTPPVPDYWAAAEEKADPAQPQQPVSELGWKEFFQSPELQKLIQTALNNNLDLRAAMLNVEAARALYRIERSALFPSVDAGTGYTRQNIPEALSGNNPLASGAGDRIVTQYRADLSTAFELDLFGRIQSLSESALEDYFALQSARDAAQITLISEVANAYLQWLADRKLLALSLDTLQAQQKSGELIGANREAGIASQLDVARVQTAVETARANAAVYARLVEQDKNALFLLLGTHDDTLLPQQASLEDIKLLHALPSGLSSNMLLARPDVAQAEHRLLAANADIGAARAAFFPSISLTGNYGYASGELDDLFSSGASGAWAFAPQVSVPIFRGGFNIANLAYSKKAKEIAAAQYEGTIQTAFREVADELAARKTFDEQLSAQRALVRANQQAYDLSYARYNVGLDSFLDALDAQRSLYAAQQTAIDVERQWLANFVNLYRVLGGGLIAESLDTPPANVEPAESTPSGDSSPIEKPFG